MNQIIHWVFYLSSVSGPFPQGFNGDIIINSADSVVTAYYHNPTYSSNKVRNFKITHMKDAGDRVVYICWDPKVSQSSLVMSVFRDYIILYDPIPLYRDEEGKEVHEAVTYYINKDAINKLSRVQVQKLGEQSLAVFRRK
jgi:hypothetical protein